MRILFFADIVGDKALSELCRCAATLREAHDVTLMIANCENAAGGFGVTPEQATRLLDSGFDVLTSGNHIFAQDEIRDFLEKEPRLLRPDNILGDMQGGGALRVSAAGYNFQCINLITSDAYPENVACPFERADELLSKTDPDTVTFIDCHGLNPGIKRTLAHHLAGRVSCLVGTHTHTQTADEHIIEPGLAYISDVGMTGVKDSIQGGDLETMRSVYRDGLHDFDPLKTTLAEGSIFLQAVLVQIDPESNKAVSITRLSLPSAEV